MKDELIEDVIRISSQLVKAQRLLCYTYGLFCNTCPLRNLDDCSDFHSVSCLEYNNETGKYE